MQLYWTLKSIPELSDRPSAERRRLWRKAYLRTFRHWPVWVGLLSVGACNVAGRSLGAGIGHDMLGSLIGAGVGAMIYSQIAIHVARPYLREMIGANHSPDIFS